MKVKFLCAAFAALVAFSSCSNEEGVVAPGNDGVMKSVKIDIANLQKGARGTGTQKSGDVTVVKSLQVIFSDGSSTKYYGNKFNDEGGLENLTADDLIFETDAAENGQTALEKLAATTFHNLPANVEYVYVLANMDKNDEGEYIKYESQDEIDFTLNLANGGNNISNDAANLFLYGYSVLAMDGNDTEDGNVLYKASVTLNPAIARIEITGFEVTDNGTATTKWSSFTLNEIALNGYGKTATITNGAYGYTTGEQDDATSLDESNVYTWLYGVSSNADIYDNLNLTMTCTEYAGSLSIDNTETADATEVLAYHVFPTTVPSIVLSLTGVEEGVSTPLYLQTTSLLYENDDNTTEPLTTLEAGKIYRLAYKFDQSNLTETEKCVDLDVTVAQWVVVDVTPTF